MEMKEEIEIESEEWANASLTANFVNLTPNSQMVVFSIGSKLIPLNKRPCICDRENPVKIICENPKCNFSSDHGRTRKCCESHPNLAFLLDLPRCPKCRSACIEYKKNEDIPKEMIKKSITNVSTPTLTRSRRGFSKILTKPNPLRSTQSIIQTTPLSANFTTSTKFHNIAQPISKSDAPSLPKCTAPPISKSDAPFLPKCTAPPISKSASLRKFTAPPISKNDAPSLLKCTAPPISKSDAPFLPKCTAPPISKSDAPSLPICTAPPISKGDAPSTSKCDAPPISKSDPPSTKNYYTRPSTTNFYTRPSTKNYYTRPSTKNPSNSYYYSSR